MTKCYDINECNNDRFNKKLQEKIDRMTIMIIESDSYDKSQYLQGFKQGLIDAQWIFNNLI